MNKFEILAKDEEEQKIKLESGNLALYTKFDKYNYDESKDAEAYMLLTLKAPEIKVSETRKILNITALLDNSGSMNGDRIKNVKASMKKLIQHMTENDVLSIVTFETSNKVVFEPSKMNEQNKDKALKAINEVYTAGGTNLSGGLFSSIAQNKLNSCDINRIIVFTDGDANEGITSFEHMKPVLDQQISTDNISISCFGFGTGYNEELLTNISNIYHGNLFHIKDVESISTAFAKELGGLLSVFAQNIDITVTLENDVAMIEDYNKKFGEELKLMSGLFRINDIYSQESRNLLFKVKVNKCNGEKKVAKFSIKYMDLIQNKYVVDEKVAKIRFVDADNIDTEISKDVAMQISVFESAKAQSAAMSFAKSGNYFQAQTVLNDAATVIRGYVDVIGTSGMADELTSLASNNYASGNNFTASKSVLNAMSVSYSTGRSADMSSFYSQTLSDNSATADLIAEFKEPKEQK